MKGICDICGCTDNNACFDPDYGCCWWVDEERTLCSHCADVSNENSLEYMRLCETVDWEDDL